MSDEELLQIIDFMQKRDYSLQAMNEKLAAGEIESPTETVKEELEDRTEAAVCAAKRGRPEPGAGAHSPLYGNAGDMRDGGRKRLYFSGGVECRS